MTPQRRIKSRQFPTSHASGHIISSSSVDLTSPTLSPRHLYADTFVHEDPTDSSPYPRSASRSGRGPRHKNMRDMIGMTTEDEFDALPVTVRRKYFSTLERLRFAQNAGSVFFDDPSLPVVRRRSLTDRRNPRSPLVDTSRHNSLSLVSPPGGRRLRKGVRPPSASAADASWFLTLPEKIRKKEFTTEEQRYFGAHRRRSIILDAADEAIYRARRRASYTLNSMSNSPADPFGPRMDQRTGEEASRPTSVTKAMLESFHWMDEDNDLDLRLVLDDYHANLDGAVLPSPSNERRPSFRRHMSISKIPFGRTSTSSMNQSRGDTPSSPLPPTHTRKKSNTLSMITPKHAPSQSLASIDPRAAHYQDPEARLKLRVYLASPQKFDEAIEFGFPSRDGVADGTNKENKKPRQSPKEGLITSPLGSTNQTFFNDDNMSLASEDDTSMVDPASPLTPKEIEEFFKPPQRPPSPMGRLSSEEKPSSNRKPAVVKQAEPYTQSAGAREMTLRMTLTRPDLRADESAIYGWQNGRTRSPRSPLSDEPMTFESNSPSPEKADMVKGPFGGPDGWGPPEKDNGVVRRLWNRVKSSQRKSS